jgi:hypothetical protein
VIIPTLSDGTAFYSQRVNLDGTDFQLDFRWSTREARWYLRLLNTTGDVLVGPMKLVVNWPLLHYYHGREGVPTGEIWCMTVGASTDPPGISELGEGLRCQLEYIPLGAA